MSTSSVLQPDPSSIGGISKAPFVLRPDPSRVFGGRASRLAALAETGDMAPYLRFLSGVTRAQADVAAALPPVRPLDNNVVQRALSNGMPPLDRSRLAADTEVASTLDAYFDAVAPLTMPVPAREALAALRSPDTSFRDAVVTDALTDLASPDRLAAYVFVAAGLQVHATRLAATLEASALKPIGPGLCPACGGRPVASIVVGFLGAEGARYGVCSFCATLWNEVRIKCMACGSTEGVGYRAVESDGEAATVKAEVCDQCRSWVKILYQNKNPSLDAVADDVGTLALDLLMQSTDYRRAGVDPFLLGY